MKPRLIRVSAVVVISTVFYGFDSPVAKCDSESQEGVWRVTVSEDLLPLRHRPTSRQEVYLILPETLKCAAGTISQIQVNHSPPSIAVPDDELILTLDSALNLDGRKYHSIQLLFDEHSVTEAFVVDERMQLVLSEQGAFIGIRYPVAFREEVREMSRPRGRRIPKSKSGAVPGRSN